ncbi:hypothetical protein [Singulisphaera acidiphila]|uniref:Uncharacterized protein n=1 Tax=Singulisphaera acidiphila (strain ATCC BAA-1392 / DSM 18658 / VKM B-2454 / MOB10) TaxID=886293 RepID=L0DI10_SINAD|nr:hypothetical protein [Singulisphaera acidiphila]AGA28877.1 hypothetical protein Sinac_4703 [Singulisphaera acidiphila DSM 18658]
MSLSQKIAAALDALPDIDALPCPLTVEDVPHRLTLNLTAAGPVGIAFDSLDFATAARSGWSSEDLKAWADRIASRVTYLMEPLVVLEHDKVGGEVELRSQAPTSRGDRRTYFEVRLHHQGRLKLLRIAVDEPSRQRHPTSCQMTREVLERLADDLVESVG